jgi:hypothetical protein
LGVLAISVCLRGSDGASRLSAAPDFPAGRRQARTSREVIMTRLLTRLSGLVLALVAMQAYAEFHLWKIESLYSNADGTIQYVVLYESKGQNGEDKWADHALIAAQTGAGMNTYVFPDNLPNTKTANKRALVASEGFAALGLIAPDFVIPNGFIGTGDGYVNFATVDQVAYTSLPTDGDMMLTRDGDVVQNVATNYAGQKASVPKDAKPPAGGPVVNYQGLWWNSPAGSESGWGINFAHQGDTIFASWFTFDVDGSPLWFVTAANKVADKVYTGSLVRGTGPAYNAVPFNPSDVHGSTVGTATFTFTDESNGTFAFTIGATSITKNITKQVFASPVPSCTWNSTTAAAAATNYQDLWWVPGGAESGWGINFTHQGDTIFGTWFTFGLDGKPLWFVVSAAKTAPGVYSGKLYRGTGPAYNAPFDASKLVPIEAGTATFTFTDGNTGTFAATIDGGAIPTKAITRQVFSPPGTVCQ